MNQCLREAHLFDQPYRFRNLAYMLVAVAVAGEDHGAGEHGAGVQQPCRVCPTVPAVAVGQERDVVQLRHDPCGQGGGHQLPVVNRETGIVSVSYEKEFRMAHGMNVGAGVFRG